MKANTMNDDDYERRKQQRLRKLGTQNPQCATCGENHWECLQVHEPEGRAYGDTRVIECANCHSRVSVKQYGHPVLETGGNAELTTIARLLEGFADLLELVIEKLRQAAATILTFATTPKEI